MHCSLVSLCGLPESSDSFDILDFNTVSESFDKMRLPPLEDSLLWDTSELLTRGDLCVGSCPATIEGNFNYDGTVDAADYLLWKTNFEALASGSEGTAAVPEPTILLLALAAVPLRVRCG